jgi:hypothetical protein
MEAALVNSVISRPAPACAQHARKKFSFYLILWVVVLVSAVSLTSSHQAIGASNPITPIGDNPTPTISLSGVVFFDGNQDGTLDNKEIAISGVTIDLYKDGGSTPYATATVNSVGQYSFTGIAPGTYSIHNSMNAYWLPTPGLINGVKTPTTAGLAAQYSTNIWGINNVVLSAGDQATFYNFAAQYYPIQLLSKRMLLATAGEPTVQAVPEPGTAVMLGFAACAFVVMAAKRRYCQK